MTRQAAVRPSPAARTRRATRAPADAARFAPSAERPVRAHSQFVDPDTDIVPHSHPWAQVSIAASGVARITALDATWLWKGLLWISVVLTVVTGVQYLWRAHTAKHSAQLTTV